MKQRKRFAGQQMFDRLEDRRLLSLSFSPDFAANPATPVPVAAPITYKNSPGFLSSAQVQQILAQAISQAGPTSTEVAVVTDREGTVLGALAAGGAAALEADDLATIISDATVRARTASFFESNGEAFTTRTARFIIQNHFPQNIKNTAGGPLYGVEFSDLPGTDILLPEQTPGISGDPGGIPLYIHGVAVGGIGVAGDFHDVAANQELAPNNVNRIVNDYTSKANPHGLVFTGAEEKDRDEAVAQAGARGFMAPPAIRATNIFVGGLRFPFVAEAPASGKPQVSFQTLTSSGAAVEMSQNPDNTYSPVVATGLSQVKQGIPEKANVYVDGVPGLIRVRANVQMSNVAGVPVLDANGNPIPHTDPQDSDPLVAGAPAPAHAAQDAANPGSASLTVADVQKVIEDAVAQAERTRAGIRKPNGVNAEVHVEVVDPLGQVLGSFQMGDGTNFSYDVAVQKARTAAFFSDDTHAFTCTGIGFMAERFFPQGIVGSNSAVGPLFLLQDALSFQTSTPVHAVTESGNTVTVTTPNTFSVGQIVTMSGMSISGYNGVFTITSVTANGFTYTDAATGLADINGTLNNPVGTASVGKVPPFQGLADGITIFPGGVPLYKNGVFVGAVGVSGDGVTQDDFIASGGAKNFAPNPAIRCDNLGHQDITNYIVSKVQSIVDLFGLNNNPPIIDGTTIDFVGRARSSLNKVNIRLPYVKFPRNPFV